MGPSNLEMCWSSGPLSTLLRKFALGYDSYWLFLPKTAILYASTVSLFLFSPSFASPFRFLLFFSYSLLFKHITAVFLGITCLDGLVSPLYLCRKNADSQSICAKQNQVDLLSIKLKPHHLCILLLLYKAIYRRIQMLRRACRLKFLLRFSFVLHLEQKSDQILLAAWEIEIVACEIAIEYLPSNYRDLDSSLSRSL